jgi:NAD(P)-dependent dehydrogenase (short-subunit alcohol dehydrogenase family)
MRGLVTGASRGLGLEIARQLSETHSELILISRNAERLRSIKLKSKIIPYAVDLSRDITDFLHDHEFGHVDTFVHCAGITYDNLLLKSKFQDIQSVFQTNLISGIQLSQKLVRNMIKMKKGNIIFISSCVGLKGNAGQAVYSASKAGIYGLTRSLAKELGPKGIRVNAISPGVFETDMTSHLSQEKKREYISKTSLGRLGDPREIRPAVQYLLDSTFVTGQVIEVDGGLQF